MFGIRLSVEATLECDELVFAVSSSRRTEAAGLMPCSEETVDIRFNHDEPALVSLRSLVVRVSAVRGRRIPDLFKELALDSAVVSL